MTPLEQLRETSMARRLPFGRRLLVAQALVLVTGALATFAAAMVIGPSIFHDHLSQAGMTNSPEETDHVEQAFRSALLVSIGVAVVVAVAAALAASLYFSRRVQRSIGDVAAGASEIAAGRVGAHVADPGLGPEFATLAATYNMLGERLAATEATRRRMLADLAHEMRTPLATVDAHLEAVEDGVRRLDDGTLDVIRASTQRLRRLAEDIAAVSNAEEGNLAISPVPVEAVALAETAVATAREAYAARGVALELGQAPASGTVLVDPDRMGQVLGNLLDNALRHTETGGTVSVECRRSDPGWVELVVADTGEGIPAEHLGHVFDRFYRVDTARDRRRGGSGIGLSIARALVEAHGGDIAVTSDGPGLGSTFTVRLPVASH